MNLESAHRLLERIPDNALVVDVGGGAAPFPRADHVIDALPFEAAGAGSDGNIHARLSVQPRYSRATWTRIDLCCRTPWPFPDKHFDFAICSHLLEDIRDPIWVCSELRRIAHAGYIEVPSRIVEQSLGVENPRQAGYYHHRWLITREGQDLFFRHKPHLLHSVRDAIVTRLGPTRQINPHHAIVTLDWREDFGAEEVLEFDESVVVDELCAFAERARGLTNLTIQRRLPVATLIRKRICYFRLWLGYR
jgi:hypothetical protein